MFLEVKNFENLNRKVVFHPNTIFKNHHFDIIFHTFGALGHFPLSAVFKVIHPYRFYKGQNRYPLKTWLKISKKIPKNHQKSEKIQKIQKSKNVPKRAQKRLHYAEIAFFPIFASKTCISC